RHREAARRRRVRRAVRARQGARHHHLRLQGDPRRPLRADREHGRSERRRHRALLDGDGRGARAAARGRVRCAGQPARSAPIEQAGELMDRERLKRIRNWQSSEFYSRLVMRPVSILIMLVVADWRWLTPNLVTTFANVAKLTGAVLIVI